MKKKFTIFILLILVISIIFSYSALSQNTVFTIEKDEISAFNWIKTNTEKEDVFLTDHLSYLKLNALASRPVVAPSFTSNPNAYEKALDINKMLLDSNNTENKKLYNDYNVSYVYISDFSPRYIFWREQDLKGYASLPEIEASLSNLDNNFKIVYEKNEIRIYKVE